MLLNVCCICLDNNNTDMMTTKCNHHMHKNCLTKWLNVNCSCPMCRTKINPVDYTININKNKNINIVDNQDNNGMTALMTSCIMGNLNIVRMIVNMGANLNLVDNNNKTAFDYARENNQMEIVNFFNTL